MARQEGRRVFTLTGGCIHKKGGMEGEGREGRSGGRKGSQEDR